MRLKQTVLSALAVLIVGSGASAARNQPTTFSYVGIGEVEVSEADYGVLRVTVQAKCHTPTTGRAEINRVRGQIEGLEAFEAVNDERQTDRYFQGSARVYPDSGTYFEGGRREQRCPNGWTAHQVLTVQSEDVSGLEALQFAVLGLNRQAGGQQQGQQNRVTNISVPMIRLGLYPATRTRYRNQAYTQALNDAKRAFQTHLEQFPQYEDQAERLAGRMVPTVTPVTAQDYQLRRSQSESVRASGLQSGAPGAGGAVSNGLAQLPPVVVSHRFTWTLRRPRGQRTR